MQADQPSPAGGSRWRALVSLSPCLLVSLSCLLLLAWQGWLTLGLFGPEHAWERLTGPDPIVSGRHPLHLYHGWLGAQAIFEQGGPCCYDPSYQAGYPKTPIFDSGSRPGELFLLLTGGRFNPAAYKIGLALSSLLVPLLLALTARLLGLGWTEAGLAALFSFLIWWGTPCQEQIQVGNLDLLIASLALLTQTGLLVRFDRHPGFWSWLGAWASGYAAWWANPLFAIAALPLALIYYLSVGHRHQLLWHLALLVGFSGAVVVNGFWLFDWVAYWWIRAPLRFDPALLAHRTFSQLWQAPLWGDCTDRVLTVALLVMALAGVCLLNARKRRSTARLLGTGAAVFLALSVAGITLDEVGRLGTANLLVPALLFAVLPASHLVAELVRLGIAWRTKPIRLGLLLMASSFAVGMLGTLHGSELLQRLSDPSPLVIGLDAERQEVVETLRRETTVAARILWEDRSECGPRGSCYASRIQREGWTALLARLTGRFYVGGLDPDAGIEHAYIGLSDQVLAGRPIDEWTDADLEDYCRRYNIGWVVCWTNASRRRFSAWEPARAIATFHDGTVGTLFEVHRTPSYALKGQATVVEADSHRIALDDVVPEDGCVVLSLHYQAGMKASPSRVQVERERDPHDLIPLVRLRVTGPVARLTLTWEGR